MKNSILKRSAFLNKTTLFLALFVMAYNYSFAQKKQHDKLLDNKTYIVDLTLQGGKKTPKPIPDELNFKTDKFKSKAMADESEFAAGAYTATIDTTEAVKVISFDAESKNPNDEILHWVGTVTGENIEGKATLIKKGKTKKEYAFTGTLKTKKKK
jgi:hypothetical protein